MDDAEWWLDEIDLDPSGSHLHMATRALGAQRWLVIDDRRPAELVLKSRLRTDRRREVFAAMPATEPAGAEVCALLEASGVTVADLADAHPLEQAGLSVQEDLCLLRRGTDGWHLEAASVSFPSRWRLADKIGRPLVDVHAPVSGYAPQLADRVTTAIDRLGDRIVRRRNWFVHPDPTLFQPSRPSGGDPVVPAPQCLDDLFVRSERQTLRRLDLPGWALFTIRIQQCRLRRLAERRPADLIGYLAAAPDAALAHRGVSRAQWLELTSRPASPLPAPGPT